jgi:Nucleotidyl transferase AbiEii toxin, Type IV TA system
MSRDPYLHELDDFPDLLQIVADEKVIIPQLVEKDYWIMHCLYGLTKQGLQFELKGGTSLSKGFGIIHRFSEDIDIRIDPSPAPFEVFTGKNQTKKDKHIQSRKDFYDWLAGEISIAGIEVVRDNEFDDKDYYRNGGIRLNYNSHPGDLSGIKEGVLLEIGFDDTAPNTPVTISSWAYDKAITQKVAIRNNQAIAIKCYDPAYTFVEKLQTVSTKYRKQQESGELPTNFLRHYYDIFQLLDHPDVLSFIGTEIYQARKKERFRSGDNLDISKNEAFLLNDKAIRKLYTEEFLKTASLYHDEQPEFEDILKKIGAGINRL